MEKMELLRLRRWIQAAGLACASVLLIGCAVAGAGAASDEQAAAPPTQAEHTTAPTHTPVGQTTSTTLPSPSPMPTATVEPTATPLPVDDLPLSSTAYTLPLTLRHLTPNTATLFFELAAPAPGSLIVNNTGTGERIAELPLPDQEARHLLTVEGLEPGTHYDAVVALNGAEGDEQPQFMGRVWSPLSFETPAEGAPVRFGVLGDASFGDPATIELIEQMAAADLDFAIHTGDVVDETELGIDPFDSYARKFYTPFEPLLSQMPVYTVPGNHDYDADIRWQEQPFYYHAFPPFSTPDQPEQGNRSVNQYYAFEYDGVQFIMLDSQVLFGVPGINEQREWLNQRLADPSYRASVVVFHVSPYSSSSVHPTNSDPPREYWTPLFEAAGVPLVLSGHYHQYERSMNGSTTYIVSGGGSSILYAPAEERRPESQVFATRTHFVLLELNGDTLDVSAVALGGDVIDQATIPLPAQ